MKVVYQHKLLKPYPFDDEYEKGGHHGAIFTIIDIWVSMIHNPFIVVISPTRPSPKHNNGTLKYSKDPS